MPKKKTHIHRIGEQILNLFVRFLMYLLSLYFRITGQKEL